MRLRETIPPRETAPPIVFLHGRLGASPIWTPLIAHLGRDRRCATLDLPGFGRSFVSSGRSLSLSEHASLVGRIVDQVADRVVLVGDDFGGALAQAVSIMRPDRVLAVVLINSACLMEELPEFSARTVRKALRKASRQSTQLDDSGVRSVRESWGNPWATMRARRAIQAIRESWPGEMQRQQWRREISSSSHPVLLVWSGEGGLHPVRIAFKLMQTAREAHFVELDGCSLWPSLETPEALAYKVREFFFRIGGGSLGGESAISRARRSL